MADKTLAYCENGAHHPNQNLTHVRGHEADGRNFGHFSMTCDRRIRGVCLSRGGCLGWLFDREDLLRH